MHSMTRPMGRLLATGVGIATAIALVGCSDVEDALSYTLSHQNNQVHLGVKSIACEQQSVENTRRCRVSFIESMELSDVSVVLSPTEPLFPGKFYFSHKYLESWAGESYRVTVETSLEAGSLPLVTSTKALIAAVNAASSAAVNQLGAKYASRELAYKNRLSYQDSRDTR